MDNKRVKQAEQNLEVLLRFVSQEEEFVVLNAKSYGVGSISPIEDPAFARKQPEMNDYEYGYMLSLKVKVPGSDKWSSADLRVIIPLSEMAVLIEGYNSTLSGYKALKNVK